MTKLATNNKWRSGLKGNGKLTDQSGIRKHSRGKHYPYTLSITKRLDVSWDIGYVNVEQPNRKGYAARFAFDDYIGRSLLSALKAAESFAIAIAAQEAASETTTSRLAIAK